MDWNDPSIHTKNQMEWIDIEITMDYCKWNGLKYIQI